MRGSDLMLFWWVRELACNAKIEESLIMPASPLVCLLDASAITPIIFPPSGEFPRCGLSLDRLL